MQHTSMSPDRKLLTVVGDDCNGLLVDARNGRVSLTASGFYNLTFSILYLFVIFSNEVTSNLKIHITC